MNDIDFLPSDYVCVQTTRTNNNWLRGLFVAVLGLMAVGWVAQQKSLNDLRAKRTHAQESVRSMLASLDSSEKLRADLDRADNAVRILDGLRTQVPPTRWLGSIVDALPSRLSLLEIHADIDEGVDPAAPRVPQQVNAPAIDPVRLDIERLSKVTPRRSVTISIRGSAPDDIEVSRFLTALHRIDYFDQVQLLFTDQHGQGSQTARSFAIRLKTKSLNRRATVKTVDQPVATAPRDLQ
ncbi:MAG: hypothetical protein WCJ09_00765 [Planctomycetota bacterium]